MTRTLAALLLALVTAAMAGDLNFAVLDSTGLPARGSTFGGTWALLDDDPYWDLIFSRHADDHVEIYRGRPDLRFAGPAAATVPSGLLDHHGTAACDHDLDGRWDLYLSAGADRGHGVSCKQLWRATGPLAFTNDVPCDHLLADPAGRGRGALWLALGQEPRPRLLVLNFATPPRLFRFGDQGWREAATDLGEAVTAETDDLDGDGRLDLITVGRESRCWRQDDGGLALQDSAFGTPLPTTNDLATGDLDGDGRPDLVLGVRGGALWVLRNVSRPGAIRFVLASQLLSRPPVAEPVSLALADLDNDGLLDLVVAHRASRRGRAPLLYRGRGDGTFDPVVTLPSVPSRATALWAIDLDHDGDLELAAFHGEEVGHLRDGSVVLYENLTTSRGVTITLAAEPGRAPHGLGAAVDVQVGDRHVVGRVRAEANPWNSTVLPIHVGVGDDAGPYRLTVNWPDGRRQVQELPGPGAYRLDGAGLQRLP